MTEEEIKIIKPDEAKQASNKYAKEIEAETFLTCMKTISDAIELGKYACVVRIPTPVLYNILPKLRDLGYKDTYSTKDLDDYPTIPVTIKWR